MKMFHVETARGEAVCFTRQGHTQEAVVVMVYENGKPPIERRLSCWDHDTQRLWDFARDFGLLEQRSPHRAVRYAPVTGY